MTVRIDIDPARGSVVTPGAYRVRFSRAERMVLRKKKAASPSVWAERHRVLPADSWTKGGPWKNANAPYLAGIMDASFFDSVREIYIVAPPQSGKSEAINNCLAYGADRRPGNALVTYPDELTGKENMRDRLLPMFKDSPRLRGYLSGVEDDEAAICLRLKHMKIHIAWANSAARLANKPVMYAVGDEVGKWGKTAGKKEASGVDLLRKRLITYEQIGQSKLWLASTPNIEEDWIWVALTQWAEAVFVYFVRCPLCGARQEMVFAQVKWEGGGGADPREVERLRSAWYECCACAGKWDDAARNRAALEGEWREKESGLSLWAHLRSHQPLHIGFHYRAYCCAAVSLSKAVAKFLWGLKDKTAMKDWHNAYDVEPWREYDKVREESRILALCDGRPAGMVPGGGVIAGLTAGVDTQDDGFWFVLVAWGWAGAGLVKSPHVVRMGFVADFGAVARVLWEDAYTDAEGARYAPVLSVQDALGHRTSEVYTFCKKNPGRIVPAIGRDTMAQPVAWGNQEFWPGTKKPIPGGLKLLNVNTKFFKDDLAARLEVLPGDPGGIRFPGDGSETGAGAGDLNIDYARHFTSEYIDEKGLWACPGHLPNHLWDCLVLAAAAYEVVGMVYWAKAAAGVKTEEDRSVKSKWVDRPKKRWVS